MFSLTKEFFQQNRKKLFEEYFDYLPLVFTANGMLQRNNDVTFSFRQESNFWYLTGINKPNIVLVIDRRGEYLILPERNDIIKKFDGSDNLEDLTSISGINEILYEEDGWQRLSHQLKLSKVATIIQAPRAYIDHYGIYTNPSRKRLIEKILEVDKNLVLNDAMPKLIEMRKVKRPEELIAIEKAIKLTGEALETVYKQIQSYKFEYQIEATISAHFKNNGYNHAFSPIIAGGKSACTIHNIDNDQELQRNELIVLDVGAEVDCYSADITRTFAVGKQTERQQQIYEAVKEVHDYALSEIKPGIILKEYETKVEHYMGVLLKSLGLIEINSKSEVRKFYPHATSHFLGLDTHDLGNYESPLELGMVITCEPGIYVPEENIGVRIEDDILVTDNGMRNLSQGLPVRL